MERWLSWSKAHDWKSCNGLNPFEGSNPSLSATSERVTLVPIFLFHKKSVTRSTVPPLSPKVTPGSPVRPKTSSPRLAVASSCGARLWSRRINRLTSRRPPRQQILAVSPHCGHSDVLPTFCVFESSTVPAEMPNISFSCGSHTSLQAAYRLHDFFTKVSGALIPLRLLFRKRSRRAFAVRSPVLYRTLAALLPCYQPFSGA